MKILKKIWSWVKYWLWKHPTAEPKPLKASEVVRDWVVINYHGQRISLHKNELALFNILPARDKRAMARRFKTREKKGLIKFVKINGRLTCVRNKEAIYELRANTRKSGLDKT